MNPLGTHLNAIEGYVDIAMRILKQENNMNPWAVIEAIQIFVGELPEPVKMAIDARIIDKLEDKFEQGSKKDKAMEFAMKVLRSTNGLIDYSYVIDE